MTMRRGGLAGTVQISYIYCIFHNWNTAMGRPKGAKNKTPRELEAEAKRLKEKAKLLKKIDKLKK